MCCRFWVDQEVDEELDISVFPRETVGQGMISARQTRPGSLEGESEAESCLSRWAGGDFSPEIRG